MKLIGTDMAPSDSFGFVLVVDGLFVMKLHSKKTKLYLTKYIKKAHISNTRLNALCRAERIMRKYGRYAECLQVQ